MREEGKKNKERKRGGMFGFKEEEQWMIEKERVRVCFGEAMRAGEGS